MSTGVVIADEVVPLLLPSSSSNCPNSSELAPNQRLISLDDFRGLAVAWMGMNALIVHALAACDLFSEALQAFYWKSPENNWVDGTETLSQILLHSKKWATLVFIVLWRS